MQETYYDILGVKQTDDMQTIRQAYISCMKKYHPDISNNSIEASKYNVAYEILSDDFKRSEYDKTLIPIIQTIEKEHTENNNVPKDNYEVKKTKNNSHFINAFKEFIYKRKQSAEEQRANTLEANAILKKYKKNNIQENKIKKENIKKENKINKLYNNQEISKSLSTSRKEKEKINFSIFIIFILIIILIFILLIV